MSKDSNSRDRRHTVRFPPGLKLWAEEYSKERGTSLNALIVQLLADLKAKEETDAEQI